MLLSVYELFIVVEIHLASTERKVEGRAAFGASPLKRPVSAG